MARKAEVGIEYFPINTDIVHNKKIKLVVAEFGPKAWAVLLPLYCSIYKNKGYWIDWLNDDDKIIFAQDECKMELSSVNEIVNGCIRRSLFDQGVFDMFGVLTSDRIQDNYLTAKSRVQSVDFIKEFAVKGNNHEFVYKTYDNVNIIDLNVNIITKKVDTGTQNKRRIKEEGKGEANDGAGKVDYSSVEKNKNAIYHFINQHKPSDSEPYKDLWNCFAQENKLAEIKLLTTKRKKKFVCRMGEPAFNFLQILTKAKQSDFLRTSKWFGWDWIFENQENYLKVLEGNYDVKNQNDHPIAPGEKKLSNAVKQIENGSNKE